MTNLLPTNDRCCAGVKNRGIGLNGILLERWSAVGNRVRYTGYTDVRSWPKMLADSGGS
jgi:hypothetical protein